MFFVFFVIAIHSIFVPPIVYDFLYAHISVCLCVFPLYLINCIWGLRRAAYSVIHNDVF